MNYKFDIVNIFLIPLFPIFNESRCNNENTKIDFKIAISQHKQYGVPENGLPAMENDTKKHFIENFPEIKFIINAKFDNKHEYVIDYYKKAIKNPKYSIVSTNKNLIFPIPCNKWNKLDLKISNIFIDGEESDDINLEITKKSSVFLTIGLPH